MSTILSSNGISGEIPPELGNLSSLKYLDLSANRLSGQIPPELGNLHKLVRLWLDNCGLNGEIPKEIGRLTNLDMLFLHRNQLSGGIPPELGNLVNLKRLYLYGNQLSGEIPPKLANLTNLLYLDIGLNQLGGEIPPGMYDLSKLKKLDLRWNRLEESKLQRWIGFAGEINLNLEEIGEDNESGPEWREFKVGLYFDDSIHDRNLRKPLDATFRRLLSKRIDQLLDQLTERESRVLKLRFGLEDGRSRTLEEVGREFGVGRETIRRVEAGVLRELRQFISSRESNQGITHFDHLLDDDDAEFFFDSDDDFWDEE